MKYEKIAYFLMIVGILLFVIASADLVSIIISVIEKLFSIHLNASFFNDFIFRSALLVCGGILLLVEDLLLKKNDTKIE